MQYRGNIRKMRSKLGEPIQYKLPLYQVLDPALEVDMNALLGKEVRIVFEGGIHCVVTGKKIKKTFGDGMSYEAFMESPQASPSIIRPELSRIHEGIAIRDYDWEVKHHLQPHITYLSLTSGVKVGVTRETQIPTRWIDQGAVQAIILAETPYRQAAGLIEVALKEFVTDKTSWQRMLKNDYPSNVDLVEVKSELIQYVPEDLQEYISETSNIRNLNYPVMHYPEKVKSIKLDKSPILEKTLIGIKGQYLIFEDNTVLNLRSHTGYEISLEA
jgi:hypothetical protein